MNIWKNKFEKIYMDTIAAIYLIEDGKKTAVKPDEFGRYSLCDSCLYLIVCGLSDYHVKNNEIERFFISKHHPLYFPSE